MMRQSATELDTASFAVGLATVPLLAVLIVGTWSVEAFVLWKIWTWHLMPLGAPHVPYAAMLAAGMGYGLLVASLRPHVPPGSEWKRYGAFLLQMGLALLLSWLFT